MKTNNWVARALAVWASLVVAGGGVIHAAEGPLCLEYRIHKTWTSGYASGSTANGACSAFASEYAAAGTVAGYGGSTRTGSGSASGSVCTVSGTQMTNCRDPAIWGANYPAGCDIPEPYENTFAIGSVEVDCPTNPCTEKTGQRVKVWGEFADSPVSGGDVTMPMDGCHAKAVAATGCKTMPNGNLFCGVTYQYGDATTTPVDAPPVEQGACAVQSGGTTCNVDKDATSGKDCGTFNGDKVCFDGDVSEPAAAPEYEKCFSSAGGGLLCEENASIKDSTGNTVAPDGTISNANGRYNYYSRTTVESNGVSATVQDRPSGTGDNGTDDDAAPATVSGGEGCGTPPVCANDAVGCAIIQQAFLARCPASVTDGEITAALGSEAQPFTDTVDIGSLSEAGISTGGTCPAPRTITVMGADDHH